MSNRDATIRLIKTIIDAVQREPETYYNRLDFSEVESVDDAYSRGIVYGLEMVLDLLRREAAAPTVNLLPTPDEMGYACHQCGAPTRGKYYCSAHCRDRALDDAVDTLASAIRGARLPW